MPSRGSVALTALFRLGRQTSLLHMLGPKASIGRVHPSKTDQANQIKLHESHKLQIKETSVALPKSNS